MDAWDIFLHSEGKNDMISLEVNYISRGEETYMRKYCIFLFVLLLALGLCFAANADQSEDYGYILLADGTALIIYYSGSAAELTVPDVLDGYSVSSIGDYAFSSCDSLTAITLPDSITKMGANPFVYCGQLTNIQVSPDHPVFATIDGVLFNKTEKKLVCYPGGFTATEYQVPKGIRSIGDDAFFMCSSLAAITLPEGLTSIGDNAFSSCSSLTAITLPDSITEMGANPFVYCKQLTNIQISPDHPVFATIDGVLFNKTEKKLVCYPGGFTATEYQVPKGIRSIGDYAFSSCDSLTAITLPEGLTSIGDSAFSSCDSLTAITLPEGVTNIGDATFAGCYSLAGITLPESVTSIGDSAFENCYSLTAITLPEGLTSIGDAAFFGCSRLAAITLPESLESIGTYAFANCPNNMQFTVVRDSYAAKWCQENGLNYTYPDALD